jgi:hypothetical protein
MLKRNRRRAEDALLLALASGATVEAAARQCGLSERTAYRRLADPEFRRQQQELRADMARQAGDALTAAGREAIETLRGLLKSPSETTRLQASRAILQLGLKFRAADVEERLADVEDVAADATAAEKGTG